jgi:SAM-dependent methyltransferase
MRRAERAVARARLRVLAPALAIAFGGCSATGAATVTSNESSADGTGHAPGPVTRAEPSHEPGHGAGHEPGHGTGHEPGHGSHRRFDDAKQWAAVFDDPKRDAWQQPAEVVRLLELSPGLAVADVGAGTGYFLPHLQRAVGPKGRVLGLDVEPDMVRHMRERIAHAELTGAEAAVVAPDDPGLAPASIDRVLIVNTWHHIGAREAYAVKLANALRPGGFVAVVDFTLEASQGPPRSERLAPAVVERELTAGGLTPSTVRESLPDQYVVIGRKAEGPKPTP